MKRIKEYFLITLGVLILTLGAEYFLIPNDIAGGGVMGLAIIINKFIPNMPVGLLMLLMNIVLFVMAFAFVGSGFGAKSIYGSLGFSLATWALETGLKPKPITHDLFLATVFGTIICGAGIGIVFNQNASTGGTDIIAKMLNKFAHIDIGKALLLADLLITLAAGFTFNAEKGMYALLSVIIQGFVIDGVIEGFNVCKQIIIITTKYELVNKYIIEELDRGCTIVEGVGGFTKRPSYIVYTILNRKEMIRLRDYIKQVDRNAFITVTDAKEVLGEGFKNILGEN